VQIRSSETLARIDELERSVARSVFELQKVHQAIAGWRDPGTGIAGPNAFADRLRGEWRRAARERAPLSLLKLRVDDFAGYNIGLGRLIGDLTIQQVADAVRGALLRPGDFVARLVAAEFAVMLPRTAEEGAVALARRIRHAVGSLAIPYADSAAGRISVSVGASTAWPQVESTWEELELVAAASQALVGARSASEHEHILSRPLESVTTDRAPTEQTRRYPRIHANMTSRAWVERRATSPLDEGRLIVLGLGGALMETRGSYAEGSVLSIWFLLPAVPQGISCRAVVRNRPNTHRFGLEFLDLDPESRDRIAAYIASRTPLVH
jgi:diguanylate cyclase (GGDEF)-like protein